MSYKDVTPEAALFATMERHRLFVRRAMQSIRHALEARELLHDESKYREDELPGFVRINRVAREHRYGSEEYREFLRSEMCVPLHQSRNSHHPEAHIAGYGSVPAGSQSSPTTHLQDKLENVGPDDMGWLDIVEMVCDWWSACQTYGNSTWEESLKINMDRWAWRPEQRWLIEQVAEHLEFVAGAGDVS